MHLENQIVAKGSMEDSFWILRACSLRDAGLPYMVPGISPRQDCRRIAAILQIAGPV